MHQLSFDHLKWAIWRIPAGSVLGIVHSATGLASNVLWPAHNETNPLIKMGYTAQAATCALGKGILDILMSDLYDLTHLGSEVESQYRQLATKRIIADTTGKVAKLPSKNVLEQISSARKAYTGTKYTESSKAAAIGELKRALSVLAFIIAVTCAIWIGWHVYQARV